MWGMCPDVEACAIPARLAAAEHRAREILRFSPLITDAYFHYTPSQIMLAALSFTNHGLTERLIAEIFYYIVPPANNSGADTPALSGPDAPAPPGKPIIGSYIRDKVLGTIEAYRDMLSKELPEQREHWTNASKKADSENGDAEDGTGGGAMEDDEAVFGGPLLRDPKRRKVGKALDDPFGPPL
ncbi:uncharacterized protein B0T15DRAFT_573650 [Chaetomium strumarium]|uniref:Cyclin C-terminal domain-containing protein n=1 Tax=Chaetomium strumarium TaxID=1170767 RepID=A0AAJ0GV53_9PEZI|nr:hypothetical protein B0T15DRAFT_573650 [Chaetomium strumarium]